MTVVTNPGERRLGLDALVEKSADTDFVVRHRRIPVMRERSGHASPAMLAIQPPRSRYVRKWRRHARRCPECAAVFRYLGLSLR
jgi:hypothetical protein